jgi:hypothetical protein
MHFGVFTTTPSKIANMVSARGCPGPC